jgi:hypothetical protein
MVDMKLYVEGGGDAHMLKTACRQGFSKFLKKAGLGGHMPRIVACGSRGNAYDAFCTALSNGDAAMLLVDSKGPIVTPSPWQHLLNRPGDNWAQPEGVLDDHCHLMVQCMETWFLADQEMLAIFFGQGFNAKSLPRVNVIEDVSKSEVYKLLAKATKNCKTKTPYSKGKHSFELLALVDPTKVMSASTWAKRFIEEMKKQSGLTV